MKMPEIAAAVLSIAAGCCLLSGCNAAPHFPTADLGTTSSPATITAGLRGRLHGGQQPIAGAHIYLFAAGTTGYGSASTSLLTSSSYPLYPSAVDANGLSYVTTDSGGFFQIVDQCTPGQQVYIASVGGNPGAGANSAAVEIALLGQCPTYGNFDSTLTNVFISEISTVAAAYATSAYAVDAFHIGGPNSTTLEQTALANAFANGANLFDVQNINGYARVASLTGNGVVPQAKIHTLANILAACVNSTGPASAACSGLFANALSAGSTGTVPADVTAAAINIAHNPTVNVSALYALPPAVSPFSPQLASAPNDFALSISFPGAALGSNPSLAVDSIGNVWTLVPSGTSVSKISPIGALLSGNAGLGYSIGNGFLSGRGLAVDPSNNIWILGRASSAAQFAELNNNGLTQKVVTEATAGLPGVGVTTHPPTDVTNLVIDGAGALYYNDITTVLGALPTTNYSTVRYSTGSGTFTSIDLLSNAPQATYVALNASSVWAVGKGSSVIQMSGSGSSFLMGGGLSQASAIALDNSGNAWIANAGNSSVSKFSNAGAAVSGTSGYSGGLSTPTGIVVDGDSNVWVSNTVGSLGLAKFDATGTAVGKGLTTDNLTSPGAMVIDASGDIWVGDAGSSTITEFLGVAGPVITPAATAIGANALGSRP